MPAGAKRPKFPLALALLCLAMPCPALPGPAEYPVAASLTNDDPIFRQQQDDIQRSYKAKNNGEPFPRLVIYSYTPGKNDGFDTFKELSARTMSNQHEGLATLNSIDTISTSVAGRRMLIPGVPGIFLREKPESNLEILMRESRAIEKSQRLTIDGTIFYFFPGERFNDTERTLFHSPYRFVFPLDKAVLTSSFGSRISPISGKPRFHNGIDLAAPRGSKVYAAREGTVIVKGNNNVLGIHLVLRHEGGYQTVYGHLESTAVQLNDRVKSGIFIGRVGSTGASTGPHLHFEVREKGAARNPEELLPRRIPGR